MNWLHDISPGTEDELNVVIEIPARSQNKYEYDKKNNIIILDRVLYSPVHYPGDYGFVPQTHCEDGDPLDAIILVTEPSFPGVMIKARPVAMLNMIDSGERDEKLLCVPVDDPRFEGIKSLKDVPEHILKEIAYFFQHYKDLQGKKVEIEGWEDVDKARELIRESIKMYKEKFKK